MRSITFVTLVLLVGCGGSAPTRTHYLLRADPVERSGRTEASVRTGLGRVSVSPYLDQDGIVVETETGQVKAAKLHLWAEPLEAGLRSTLHAEISRELGYDLRLSGLDRATWDYTVDVYVDRLHGSMNGSAVLEAGYRIAPRAGRAVEYRFARSAPLPREGYAGLVDAETRLVRELAAAIAASLRDLDAK